jgi:hypothetical protein
MPLKQKQEKQQRHLLGSPPSTYHRSRSRCEREQEDEARPNGTREANEQSKVCWNWAGGARSSLLYIAAQRLVVKRMWGRTHPNFSESSPKKQEPKAGSVQLLLSRGNECYHFTLMQPPTPCFPSLVPGVQ